MRVTKTLEDLGVGAMMRPRLTLSLILSALMLCDGRQPALSAEPPYLQNTVRDFCYTNMPVSHVICLLAKKSPVPIDAVIDDTNDPPVTISEEKTTVAEILQKLLSLHPGHHPHEQSGVILILPDWLLDKQVFPLTDKLARFSTTFNLAPVAPDSKQTIATCDFFPSNNPDLNISIPVFGLSRKPNYSSFPHVRTFENQSILKILTTISSEQNMSFFCYRLDKDFVKAQNKTWAEKKMGPTWWSKPDEPCYSVFWGTGWYGVRSQE